MFLVEFLLVLTTSIGSEAVAGGPSLDKVIRPASRERSANCRSRLTAPISDRLFFTEEGSVAQEKPYPTSLLEFVFEALHGFRFTGHRPHNSLLNFRDEVVSYLEMATQNLPEGPLKTLLRSETEILKNHKTVKTLEDLVSGPDPTIAQVIQAFRTNMGEIVVLSQLANILESRVTPLRIMEILKEREDLPPHVDDISTMLGNIQIILQTEGANPKNYGLPEGTKKRPSAMLEAIERHPENLLDEVYSAFGFDQNGYFTAQVVSTFSTLKKMDDPVVQEAYRIAWKQMLLRGASPTPIETRFYFKGGIKLKAAMPILKTGAVVYGVKVKENINWGPTRYSEFAP